MPMCSNVAPCCRPLPVRDCGPDAAQDRRRVVPEVLPAGLVLRYLHAHHQPRQRVRVQAVSPPHVVCAAFTHSRVLVTCSPQPQEAGRRRQPGGGSDHHLVLPVLRHLPGGPCPRPVGAHPVLQPRWLLRPAEARSRPVEVSTLASAQGPCVGAGLVLRPCRHRTGSWRVGSAACLGMAVLIRGHSHLCSMCVVNEHNAMPHLYNTTSHPPMPCRACYALATPVSNHT